MSTRRTTRRRRLTWAGSAVAFLAMAAVTLPAAAERGSLLLVCTRGPSDQHFEFNVTIPSHAEVGSTYEIRIDGVPSGKIAHFGLSYVHDMTVEYVLPAAASYVEGSARFVAGTGTPNVLAGRRVSHRGGVLTMVLPGRVENGTDYTPPNLTFQLKAIGPPGAWASVGFSQYRLMANALIVGDVAVSCGPALKPYSVGTTLITAARRAPVAG